MGKKFSDITPELASWLTEQRLFFVATAPLDRGGLVNCSPKGIVFFVAFLPQFINHSASVTQQLWLLTATFVRIAMVNATLYALFAASARRLLDSPRTWRRFNIAGGSLLFSAGV